MNLFLRELKSYKKSLFFWCLGMLALVASGMAKYASLKGDSHAVTKLMEQFPQSIQTIFGLTGFDLTKASGYYGVLFMYFALAVTVHTVLLGVGILSKEEIDRTSEFLLVKPISRNQVVLNKMLAGLFNVLVLNIVTLLASIYFVNYFASGESFLADILTLMGGLMFLQLFFFFLGITVAAICKKPKKSGSIATSVLLLAFIMTFFVNINQNLDWLKYFTPYKYFEARDIMMNGLNLMYCLVFFIAISLMVVVTFRTYNSRDLDV